MEPPPTEAPRLLRLTSGSVLRAVAMVAATITVIAVFRAATRPLGWLVVAVVGAALLGPLVVLFQRALPRALAVVAALLTGLLLFGGVAWGFVADLDNELDRVQRIAPRAAGEIERSERFGEFATEVDLRDRVKRFVDELPDRLRGGDDVEALQAAASRGVSFLITFVLLLFLLAWGPRFVDAGLAQLRDPSRREQLRDLLAEAYGRFWRYVYATLGRALLAGLVTYALVRAADLPAPVLLAVWVGAWSIVPAVGIVLGALAPALVAVPESTALALGVLGVLVGYQVVDALVLEKRIDRATLHLGSFGTFVAAALGLEAYGIGGLVVAALLAMFAAAVVRTLTTGRAAPAAPLEAEAHR